MSAWLQDQGYYYYQVAYYCETRDEWMSCFRQTPWCGDREAEGNLFTHTEGFYEDRNVCYFCQRYTGKAKLILYDSLDTLVIKDLVDIIANYLRIK